MYLFFNYYKVLDVFECTKNICKLLGRHIFKNNFIS